jgi:transcriptional regulator with XRE-family HTH domain
MNPEDTVYIPVPVSEQNFYSTSQSIVDAIKEAMEYYGITQKELSERLGISEPAMSQLLKGVPNFRLKTICKIETALGVGLINFKKHKK